MTLLETKRHFKESLSEVYSEAESAQLFFIFCYEIIGFNRHQFRRFSQQEILESDQEDFEKLITELKTGKPYQQILGKTEFYGMEFIVDENVLIPRPETEELLEICIEKIQNSKFKTQNSKLLDIGTGSGIIPIVLKKHFPEIEISAIDVSEKALEIARKNDQFHGKEIHFFQDDFLQTSIDDSFDLIVSNPPYIGKNEAVEIADSVKNFEPKNALFSPIDDPLIFYRKIADFAKKHLNENGMIFLEINQKLGQETLELFNDFKNAKLIKDLSGNDRFVFCEKKEL